MKRTGHFGTTPSLRCLQLFLQQYPIADCLLSANNTSHPTYMEHLWYYTGPEQKVFSHATASISFGVSRQESSSDELAFEAGSELEAGLRRKNQLMKKNKKRDYGSPPKQEEAIQALICQFMGTKSGAVTTHSHQPTTSKGKQSSQEISKGPRTQHDPVPKQFSIKIDSPQKETSQPECATFRAIKTPKPPQPLHQKQPLQKYRISKEQFNSKKRHYMNETHCSHLHSTSRSKSRSKGKFQVLSIKRFDKQEPHCLSHGNHPTRRKQTFSQSRKESRTVRQNNTAARGAAESTNLITHQPPNEKASKTVNYQKQEMPIKISIDIPLEQMQSNGSASEKVWEEQRQEIIREISTRVCTLLSKSKKMSAQSK